MFVVDSILIRHLVSVHDGAAPNGAAFITFTNLTGTSYTWSSVTFPASS